MQIDGFSRIVTLATLAFISTLSIAQQPATGLPPLGSFAGGPFDTVNLANLNVHFSIPVFSRPGRGIPFSYALTYDSLVWVPVQSGSTISWQPVANWGWRTATEAATGWVGYTIDDDDGNCSITYGGFRYHDPSGGLHPFLGTVVDWIGGLGCGSGSSHTISAQAAWDNSGYILTTNAFSATINAPGGLTIQVPQVGTSLGSGSITDANGNQIQVTYTASSKTTSITDTLNTTALTIVGTPPTNPPSCSPAVTYAYTAPSGATAKVTVSYSPYTVQTNFDVGGIGEFGATGECLVSSVQLPDGTAYHFQYEGTAGVSGNVTGRIASVTLPTGGEVEYSYANSACQGYSNINNCMMADGSPSNMVDELVGSPQIRTYARSYQNTSATPQQTVTKVWDYQSNETDLNFSSVYQTLRQSYQGSASGTLLDKLTTCYDGNDTNCGTATVNLTTYISRRDVYDTPGASQTAIFNYFYDPYGNLTYEGDGDYPSGTRIRTVSTNMNGSLCSSKNICDHPSNVEVLDSASNEKANTSFTYDPYGNATEVSKWVNSGFSLNYFYTYNYSNGGTLATAKDPNGTSTTYTNGSGGCNGAFPTSVSVPSDIGSTNLVTSYTYHCTGGVVTSVTDPNGAVTSTAYTKDPYYWRPESTTDALGNTTYYNYYGVTNNPGGTHVGTILSVPSPGSAVGQVEAVTSTTDTLSTPEAYGRSYLQQVYDAVNTTWNTVHVLYDGANRIEYGVNPYPDSFPGTAGSGGTALYQYDALGRPTYVTDAGGGTVSYTYNANDALVTVGPTNSHETAVSHQYEYDALGRLKSVCEVTSISGSGACAQNTAAAGFFTSYTYDPLGNLTNVSQSSQARTFTYDGVSRMLSESNPESGATQYVYDIDSTCQTNGGNLVRRTDAAGNVSCYNWDGLHRLTSVTYPSGPNAANTPTKNFVFDNPAPFGITANNSWGRLVATFLGPLSSYTMGETFSYDKGGEATDFYTTPVTGYNHWYHVAQAYFPNGVPQPPQGFYGTGTNQPFTDVLTIALDQNGWPTSMTDSTSRTTPWSKAKYQLGQTTEVDVMGGSETFTYDSNTLRMTTWASLLGSTSTQSGSLAWNKNGTLYQLVMADHYNSKVDGLTCTYSYDDLGRIGSTSSPGVNCTQALNPWTQTFSYDSVGNIKKTGTGNWNVNYNSLTNQIQGWSYDSDGNLLNSGDHTYTYDTEGRPVSLDSNSVQNFYDALGRLVEQNRGGTYTQILYSPAGQKFAYMNGSTVQKYVVPLAGGMQAVYNGSGLQYYRHADWLGTTWFDSTPAGGVYFDGAYAPFGEYFAGSGTSDRVFTGQTPDTVTGIYDFPFRQYHPTEGRWMVPDPAGLAAVDITNPQTWNRYAYMANNPLSGRDPLGLYHCIGADDDNQDDCEGNGGFWALDPGDPGYSESQVNVPPLVYNPPPDNSSYPDLGGTGGYGGNEGAFQPGNWGYQVFQGSAQTWANASGTANFFAGATLGVVGGVAAAPAVPSIATYVAAKTVTVAAALGVVAGTASQATSGPSVTFTSHGAEHLAEYGLSSLQPELELAITQTIQSINGISGEFWGIVNAGQYSFVYRAFPVAPNWINVGTYYIP